MNNKNTMNAKIIIAVFLLFVIVFTVITIVKPKSDFSVDENRALQELPGVDVDAIVEGDFQQEYSDYLSDQFIGRAQFVKLKTSLRMSLGQKEINGVYLGADDYLIEKYAASDFNEEQVEANIWFLSDFLQDMIHNYGDNHVRCFFVPSKIAIMEDQLPKNAVVYDTSFVAERLKEDLDEHDEDRFSSEEIVTDLTEILSEHSEEYIYYKTDHHWTTLGAFYAFSTVAQSLGMTNAKGEALTSDDVVALLPEYIATDVSDNFYGTTYDKIQVKKSPDTITSYQSPIENRVKVIFDDGLDEWDSFYQPKSLDEKDQYSYFFGGNTGKIQIDTGVENGKTLLLVKDSYSNSVVPYLADYYEHIIMVDLRYGSDNIHDMIAQMEKDNQITDVAVIYNTEKFMKDTNLERLEIQK